MRKRELILGLFAVLAILLNLAGIPWDGFLTVTSLTLLAMLYYFGFPLFIGIRLRDVFTRSAYSHTNAKRIIGAVGFGWALSVIIMGALFKVQFWPGGNVQLAVGLIATGVISIIASIFYFRNKDEYYKRIFKRVAIIGGLGLILYLTPTNTLIDVRYGDNPEYAELFKKMLANPEDKELRDQWEQKSEEIN